ncbi:hypothetical protein GCM10027028_46840 [Streptomyces sundarbansensis]
MARCEQLLRPSHIEVRVQLTGETGPGQVLGGGAAPHGYGGLLAARAASEILVRGDDFARKRGGKWFAQYQRANGPTDALQRGTVTQTRYLILDGGTQAVRGKELLVRLGSRGESGWDPHPRGAESCGQFTERGVLPADAPDVLSAQLPERYDVWPRCHGSLRRFAQAVGRSTASEGCVRAPARSAGALSVLFACAHVCRGDDLDGALAVVQNGMADPAECRTESEYGAMAAQ